MHRKKLTIGDATRIVVRPDYLQAVLRAIGMTQRQLAEESGIHEVSISRICTGHQMPTLKTILRIADVLLPRLSGLGISPSAFADHLTEGTGRILAQADRESANKERSKRLKQVVGVLKARRNR